LLSCNTLLQALCRPLLITKRQQEELRVDGVTVVGQPNLMTSKEFDSFCVNGVFFLARGCPKDPAYLINPY